MSNSLEDIIKQKIRDEGPMSVGAYMALALGHPEHGYYMKRDPFGRAGDFVTAPEVSQLFGEMIGAWVVDIWRQLGEPARFVLLECGPGRGTLMADMLRVGKGVPGFLEAAEIYLLEMSSVLKAKQKRALAGHNVKWIEKIGDIIPTGLPVISVANEFLDALPFKQLVKMEDGWADRCIVLDGDRLKFGVGNKRYTYQSSFLSKPLREGKVGDIYEDAGDRLTFVKILALILQKQTGAALFIDYGYIEDGLGDTFQALKGHEYVDVLSHVGDADLTSHVDFGIMRGGMDVSISGPVTQGEFLKALGIGLRAQMLAQNADEKQAEMLEKGLHRLVDSDQMGTLFKVIGFWSHDDPAVKPAGF